MKISKELFDQLEADIRAVAKALGVDVAQSDGGKTGLLTMHGLHTVVDRNRAYSDEHPGFSSGQWKRILPYTGRNYCHLYDHGLDDTHVATALRKIKQNMIEKP